MIFNLPAGIFILCLGKQGQQMEQLRIFLNSLSVSEQEMFAKKCGTSIGYLRKALAKGSKLGVALCVAIEVNSNSKVTRKDLYPDDWEKNWPELAA